MTQEQIKRKLANQTKNGLDLALLLEKASQEPAFRAEFYKRLLTDNLVIISGDSGLPEGRQILQQDTSVNIFSYPDGKIPVFTSTDRIFDNGIVKEQVRFLQMKGEDLFLLTKGATILLNPYSDFGKELLPEEIAELLNGTILSRQAKTLTVEKETKVLLGQPAVDPIRIVDSLKALFAERPAVKAAYLGWIHNPDSGGRLTMSSPETG